MFWKLSAAAHVATPARSTYRPETALLVKAAERPAAGTPLSTDKSGSSRRTQTTAPTTHPQLELALE